MTTLTPPISATSDTITIGNEDQELAYDVDYIIGRVVPSVTCPTSFDECKRMADAGNSKAQWYVAGMYENGYGSVAQDLKMAIKYYNFSCDRGLTMSKLRLEVLNATNKNTPEYRQHVMNWCKKAAVAGNSEAQVLLAAMFLDGWGVKRSWKTAQYYYQLSADQGSMIAKFRLGMLYALGIKGFRQSDTRAFAYFKSLANAGSKQAREIVGIYYMYGRGTTKDQDNAFAYFKLAADNGLKYSQFMVGFVLFNVNIHTATSYIQSSARNEFKPAIEYLANDIFFIGAYAWVRTNTVGESPIYCIVTIRESEHNCMLHRVDNGNVIRSLYLDLIPSY